MTCPDCGGTGWTMTMDRCVCPRLDTPNETDDMDHGTALMMSPVGTAVLWHGHPDMAPPSGWLFCRGQAVSRMVYRTLYATITAHFGDGDGHSTFNLPDQPGLIIRAIP